MRVVDNTPLAPLTTLRLGGLASRLVTAEREGEIVDAVREVDARGEALLVVGGGSNLVVADEGFAGTVVRIGTRGRTTSTAAASDASSSSSTAAVVLVTAQAGEPWDAFVEAVVEEGLAGVECLAGIPGLVGAVPMQNVGAYGQDVSETIQRLRAWDRTEQCIVEMERDACAFAYRSSAFRNKDRHVILDVTFALERRPTSMPIRYAELARALDLREGDRAPLSLVRETIVSLRRKKGMVLDSSDPDTASAGSFFTNPIVDASRLAHIRDRVQQALGAETAAQMPVFPDGGAGAGAGRAKISAAWLIERAGFSKGFLGPSKRVAISTKHALALTNRGGATTNDLVDLARTIRDGVRERFGVLLENEPVFVGVKL